MSYEGTTLRLEVTSDGIGKLIFDLKDQSANVLNAQAVKELEEVLPVIKKANLKGLIMTSAKDAFVLGADVTEFLTHFKKSEEEMLQWITKTQTLFSEYEDLPFPKVAAIAGFALGGGLEVALTTEYRVLGSKTKIGLPETKLGIMPGWGGTVRLSRLIGADHAMEWIAAGKYVRAEEAMKYGAADAVVAEDKLETAALILLNRAINGELNWEAKREYKKRALKLDKVESMMSFEGGKAFIGATAGPHYPAPVIAVESMQAGARLTRDEAMLCEARAFAKCTKTAAAPHLVQVFLGDQYLKKVSRKITKETKKVSRVGVLGAGIMGGGIAYQTASTGTPSLMKDIKPEQLELGMTEATKLLNKLVSRGKMDTAKMSGVLASITPTLSYGDFKSVDLVVEAVVENEKVKKAVFAEMEDQIREDAVLASNTSTISITRLAEGLKRPENFCGVHFFNPVHRMPLVEIIRGKKTSEETIAKAVQYANQIGKTPIVVNDCPGFLVNRILFPYFNGFAHLINDGVDFKRIDKVMEKFGWPMGPAYLLDVVGIDTACHASKIMAEGFPDRMSFADKTVMEVMYENNRYGQKNGKGFYEYTIDRKGKPKKELNEEVYALIKPVAKKSIEISDEEIVSRMMIPMIIEASRCLEEKIVNTATEVDMGLLLGLGFPPFRTGPLKYADTIGLKSLSEQAKKFADYGALYTLTPFMEDLAKNTKTYY